MLSLLKGQGSTSTAYGTLVSGETATTRTGLQTMVYRAGVGARLLPTLGVVASRVSLYGTAAYVAWRIYKHYSDGSTQQVDLWLDQASLGRDALFNPAGIPTDVGGANPQNSYYWAGAAMVKLSGASCSAVGTTECFAVELAPAYCGGGVPGNQCNSFYTNDDLTAQANGSLGASATTYPRMYGSGTVRAWFIGVDWDYCRIRGIDWQWTCFGSARGDGTVATATGYMLWRTLQNLSDGRTIAGAASTAVDGTANGGGAYTTLPTRKVLVRAPEYGRTARVVDDPGGTTPAITTDYNVPADAGTTPGDVTTIINNFDTPCGRALFNHLSEPGLYPWVPGCIEAAPESEPEAQTVLLPKPQLNETYTDYIDRLRDLGWVGTATNVELTTGDPAIGPEAVQKVGVTGQTGVWRRATWPTRRPEIATGTDLTIWHNPADMPTVPDDGSDDDPEDVPGGGGVIDPGGPGECNCPAVDFGPLTEAGTTDKFPFGVFSWVNGVLSGLGSDAVAPSETLTTPLGPVTIDLAGSSGNVATVRGYTDPVFKFFVVLGSIWWLATSIIGLGRGGIEHGD